MPSGNPKATMALSNRPFSSRPGSGGPRGRFLPRKEAEHRINHFIRVPQVRLVGDNVTMGVYSTQDALKMAQQLELDLVEISPQVDPPVCKIIDYKKFLYDQKKKQKEIASKAQKVVIKEVRFGPQTDDHDYAFKLKHARKFLEDGSKLKAFVFFRGRSIIFKEQGELLLLRLAQDVADLGKVEALPHLEGKRMFLLIAPIKK